MNNAMSIGSAEERAAVAAPVRPQLKRLRTPKLWKARFPLLPAIAVLVTLQIATFFFLFWLFSRSSQGHKAAASPEQGASEAQSHEK